MPYNFFQVALSDQPDELLAAVPAAGAQAPPAQALGPYTGQACLPTSVTLHTVLLSSLCGHFLLITRPDNPSYLQPTRSG